MKLKEVNYSQIAVAGEFQRVITIMLSGSPVTLNGRTYLFAESNIGMEPILLQDGKVLGVDWEVFMFDLNKNFKDVTNI